LSGRYVVSRVVQTLLILFMVLSLMWILFRGLPGDPASMYISGRLSPDDIEAIRKLWGLDAPLHVQYFSYIRNLFKGDFGISFYYRESVFRIIGPRFLNTLMLMGPAMIMSIILGTVLGSYLGWKRGSKRERVGVILSLFMRSFPIYLSGILALMLFTHYLGLFPLGGMRTIGGTHLSWFQQFLDMTHHLVLPLVVAIIYFMGDIVVISRTSMLELIGEEFLQFARARGLTDSKVRRIALRNAIIPIVTYSTIMVGFAFGGQVLLEIVFSWPGIGRLMVNSVMRTDYPVAQAAFFIMAAAVIVANLIVDLLYCYLDPRITFEKRQ
jgi:peptide/nickel transport system permease protein